MKILVTGGTGYIGSHTIIDLIENGFDVVCIDNLSRSSAESLEQIKEVTGQTVPFYEVDLTDKDDLDKVFDSNPDIDGIIHFAAFKSVGESVEKPLAYFQNNLISQINLLICAEENNIHNFIYSSSCSVYGNSDELPVTEDTPLQEAMSPYGRTKQMGEDILLDVAKATEMKFVILRYFNPVGAHPSGKIGESPLEKPNNLIPVITQTAIGKMNKMYVWGDDYNTRDGSALRDYVHVMDIAHAHTLAMEHLINENQEYSVEIYNLGTGNGVTVLEAIKAFEKISGQKLDYEMGPRRDGDVEAVYADNSKAAKNLGWKPLYDIYDMMETAWKWEQKLSENES